MRILLLTQWFDPEPTFKGLAFARELTRRGHEVEVLTGFPNYPGGKLYPGYVVRGVQRERMEGISVIRVPLYPSHDRSALRRVANYASFAVSAAFFGALLVRAADVMYVYHPPPTIALAAVVLKALRGIPFVYDVQDLWPDTLEATGMVHHKAVLKCVDLWCRATYALSDRVVVLSQGFKRKLQERGVGDKIDIILNWADETQLGVMDQESARAREPQLAGRFNVVFAGTMGKAQALEAVLDAAALVAPMMPLVQFVLVGGGIEVEHLRARKEAMGLTNVLFLPRRPMSEVGSVLAAADVLLVHLRDDPLFSITVPSKTQAYLAAGRPVLIAVRGDAAELVETAGAGVSCLPENPQSLAAAVLAMAQMAPEEREAMGQRGRAYYERELSLRVGVGRFEEVFEATAKRIFRTGAQRPEVRR